MSEGLMGFKALGWGAAAVVGIATLMPTSPNGQWDSMFTRKISELQRPSLKKKSSGSTTLGGTTTTTTSSSATTIASYPELSIVPSNFDISTELVDAPIPQSGVPDDVGAFRFICTAGQVLADDPIMFPGQPGKSHLHQFYGNTAANAYSTYESLRTSGQSTCMSPANRSAYWMPALLDGKGNVVRPDYVQIYYKRRPASDPTVSDPTNARYMGQAIPLPNGLRFIFGRDMMNLAAAPTGNFHFACETQQGAMIGAQNGYPTMDEALAVCPVGAKFSATVDAPYCWDGKNLDSADHRSHVSYPTYGWWGYQKCDADHPYVIPTFTLGARWTIGDGDDTSKWTFSSDAMAPGQPRGSTFHADWFGAWDNTVLSMWTDNCINKLLNCSGGNLGNGKMLKMFAGFSWTANPRLVPIPR